MFRYIVRVWIALSSMATSYSYAESLIVAVAANFAAPMKQLAKQFEQDTDYHAQLSLASSGKLYAQIRHGAPFDVFLSADQSKVQLLVDQGIADGDSRFTYAIGALALWSAQEGIVDKQGLLLQQAELPRIALANPKLAPYGQAAVEVLQRLQLQEKTQADWILAENISQAYQFVASGSVAFGFVAVSQIIVDGQLNKGSAWIIPKDYYQPIKQDAVILKASKDKAAVNAFWHFFHSKAATAIIASFGYQSDVAKETR